MPYLKTSSGISWHYELEGKGEALVFIHGWSVDRRIWRQQSKVFSDDYQVLTFDLPGHGETGWTKTSLETMAKDVFELTGHCGLKEIRVVGSSLGGLLALKMYEVNPHIFKKIVMVGSMPKFSMSDDYPYGINLKRIRNLGNQLERSYPTIVGIFFRSLFTKEERRTRRYKWLQTFHKFAQAPEKPALEAYLNILETEDLRPVLEGVNIPLCFINGTGDQICDHRTVTYLKEIKGQAHFIDFEQCGHFPFLTKPREFNDVLSEFLNN